MIGRAPHTVAGFSDGIVDDSLDLVPISLRQKPRIRKIFESTSSLYPPFLVFVSTMCLTATTSLQGFSSFFFDVRFLGGGVLLRLIFEKYFPPFSDLCYILVLPP